MSGDKRSIVLDLERRWRVEDRVAPCKRCDKVGRSNCQWHKGRAPDSASQYAAAKPGKGVPENEPSKCPAQDMQAGEAQVAPDSASQYAAAKPGKGAPENEPWKCPAQDMQAGEAQVVEASGICPHQRQRSTCKE